jgi:hypothetical protein
MMFEAKSYSDLEKTFVAANGFLAAAWLGLSYSFVLTPDHKQVLYNVFNTIKVDPLWGSLFTVTILSAVWGYIATFLIRLHDRLYEPHLVSWRANYETDFILRSLCSSEQISEQFFDKAFDDVKARARFMRRLFYDFMGDWKSQHQELLERFYTVIRNYWLLALAEVYCLAFLLFTAFYCLLSRQNLPPYKTWLGVLLAAILLRLWSTSYLPKIRPHTAEQVYVILHEHPEGFRKALAQILKEYNL